MTWPDTTYFVHGWQQRRHPRVSARGSIWRRAGRPALVTALTVLSMTGCGSRADLSSHQDVTRTQVSSLPAVSVPVPERFDGRTYDADIVVLSPTKLPATVSQRLAHDQAVSRTAPLSLFTVTLDGGTMTVGSGSLMDLRAFSPPSLAGHNAPWQQLAQGSAIGAERLSDLSSVVLDPSGQLPPAALAAAADLSIPTDVVVNESWAAALGAPSDNALIVDVADAASAADVSLEMEREARGRWQVITLDGGQAPRPALLAGGAVAQAVGQFTYVPHEDGTITIDRDWVAQNITTTQIPILGSVTGHRVMLPQLFGAMQELQRRGLARLIRPEQFGGSYVPRFIGRDPSRPLSLHSWGIAVDLNVATNQRGTSGDMDPRVVDVMAAWGFAWGGRWSDPDPMHFELAALRSSAATG